MGVISIITLRTVWAQIRTDNPIDTLMMFLIAFFENFNFGIKVVARVQFGV